MEDASAMDSEETGSLGPPGLAAENEPAGQASGMAAVWEGTWSYNEAMSGSPRPASIDADLILRDRCLARPADRRAWKDLYERFAPLIRGRIFFGLRSFPDHEVEDQVQAAFLKLAGGALERYEGRCSLKAYVLTLADSVRISENRRRMAAKRGNGRVVSLEEVDRRLNSLGADHPRSHRRAFMEVDSVPNPESLYLAARTSEQILEAIHRLADPRDREIVSLYFGDAPCVDRQIAEKLGMPLNTVTWRRLKALKEMRRHLAALDGGSR